MAVVVILMLLANPQIEIMGSLSDCHRASENNFVNTRDVSLSKRICFEAISLSTSDCDYR